MGQRIPNTFGHLEQCTQCCSSDNKYQIYQTSIYQQTKKSIRNVSKPLRNSLRQLLFRNVCRQQKLVEEARLGQFYSLKLQETLLNTRCRLFLDRKNVSRQNFFLVSCVSHVIKVTRRRIPDATKKRFFLIIF